VRERGVSEERVWQPWRMRANAGARIYSCGYCQWQVYQDSATCKECGKPIDWTHPRDLPFPCEEANTTTEIQVFQKWARGKRELSPYFVCDSDIEAVVRRVLGERPKLDYMDGIREGYQMVKAECEAANRSRDIPDETAASLCMAHPGCYERYKRIEEAAREVIKPRTLLAFLRENGDALEVLGAALEAKGGKA